MRMQKVRRRIAGLALVAGTAAGGLVVSAGPAEARANQPRAVESRDFDRGPGDFRRGRRVRVLGTFRSRRDCLRAARRWWWVRDLRCERRGWRWVLLVRR
jgi:hypothetical protein